MDSAAGESQRVGRFRLAAAGGAWIVNGPSLTRRTATVGLSGLALGGAVASATRSGARAYEPDPSERATASIVDFGAVDGHDIGPAVARALQRLGSSGPARLIFPAGRWLVTADADWSSAGDVTMVFEHGALIHHGARRVTLPANIETGTAINRCFKGAGRVITHNRMAVSLKQKPDGWEQYGNIAIGLNALTANTGGSNNFAIGVNALASNQTGSSNIAVGNDALRSVKGGAIPAIGTFTGYGWNNIAIGDAALRDCDTGYENLAIGALTLRSTRSGKWNVAIGHDSQILGTAGDCNVSLGAYCLTTNFGNNNLAIGWSALEGQVSGSNIAIGHTAMNANRTGTLNTAVGAEALFHNVSGNLNVAVGVGALNRLSTGSANTAIGSQALSSAHNNAGSNTAIGANALLHMTKGSGNTAVGHGALANLEGFSNSTGLGTGAAVSGSNQVQLGNSTASVHSFGALQLRSDERDKADIRETSLGLAFIRALRPVDFRWDAREDYGPAPRDGTKKRTRFHHGLVAQEVRAVLERTGCHFGGLQDHRVGGGDDVMSIGYAELIAPLIKAVQELSAEVDRLKAQTRVPGA